MLAQLSGSAYLMSGPVSTPTTSSKKDLYTIVTKTKYRLFHLSSHLFIHSVAPTIDQSIRPPVRRTKPPFTRPSIHPFIYTSIHPSIRPCFHFPNRFFFVISHIGFKIFLKSTFVLSVALVP